MPVNMYSCSAISGSQQLAPADSSKQTPSVMALFRGVRRRCRQANPCTALLVVLFLAVAFYLTSAIYGVYFHSSVAAVVAERLGDHEGPGDRRRLSGLSDGELAGQRRRKDRTGSFVVGDDEIQLCKMTSRWAWSAVERQDYLHLAAESSSVSTPARRRQAVAPSSCSAASVDPQPTLFYVDAEGALTYNHTEAAGSKYDVLEDSCEAWKIEWNSETGYVEKSVPLLANIDADFVRVSCRMRRRGTVDDGGDVDLDRTTPELRPRRSGSVERHQTPTSLMTAERRARQIHREQLRRFSPRLVGAVGLPDPLGNVPAERQTSSTDAAEKHAVAQNELRSRSDEQTLAESTTVNQGEISENREPRRGRKLEGIVDAESSLEHDWGDEGEDADSASTEVYEQWIAHIHPLRDVADRRERNHRSSGLNVLVLALESVSSISFDRVLPKSHQFLVDQPNTALFTGYNVIGDAAPANIIPLLTGVTPSELDSQRVGGEHANFVDALPFVWNKFEQLGYVTLYAEQQGVPGDTFHTDFHGFEQPPVHHYMRPFWQAADELAGGRQRRRRRGCLGALPDYRYVLRYVDEFLSVSAGDACCRYPADVPRFAFAFVSGTAEGDPTTSVGAFDEDLSGWLAQLRQSGALERTAVVVVGDHGPSYGRRRHTMLGKTEERLPLLVVSVPTWFAERHEVAMKNLAVNTDRLVTPLDVHQTLLALLHTTQVTSAEKTAALRAATKRNAVSLLDEIPVSRTCQSAGVPVHWCMCSYVEPVPHSQLDTEESDAAAAAAAGGGGGGSEWRTTAEWLVGRINELLLRSAIDARLCQPLSLMHVVNALYLIPTDLVVDVENRFYYERRLSNFTSTHPSTVRYQQIVVETSPRGGTFEATVVFDPQSSERRLSGISRISPYAGQSDCVLDQHPQLRRFCICYKV